MLEPRVWSDKYSENRRQLVELLGEPGLVKLEEWSQGVCPETGKVQDHNTQKKGTRVPKFVQDLIRLAAGEEKMSAERFIERTQQRVAFFKQRERGQLKGVTLSPSPISPEAVMLVLGWLETGKILKGKIDGPVVFKGS